MIPIGHFPLLVTHILFPMFVSFLVLWVSPISPLAELALVTAIHFFHGDVLFLIDVTNGNAWTFENEFRFLKLDHPIAD